MNKAMKEAFMKYLNRHFIAIASALSAMMLSVNSHAMETDLEALKAEAKGSQVFFNAWGGDEKINAYIR